LRSTLRTIGICVAAFTIPVGGAFTLRDSLAWLPEALWVAALPAALVCGLHWRVAGAFGLTAAGAVVMYAVNIPAATLFRVTPLTVDVWWLVGLWAVTSTAVGLVGAWLAAQWRSGARLHDLTDPLTGLPNRRRAELYLEHEFAVAQLGRPLSILLLDVDGFSAYHAVHGQASSNGVLRTLGSILRQNTRAANLSAHWGNDRFACLLNGAGEEGAFAYARLIQDCIRATGDIATVPTVSIGIGTYDSEMRTPADLVGGAEQALELAKLDGGNRIRFHGRSIEDADASAVQERRQARPGFATDHDDVRPSSSRDPLTGSTRSAFVFSGDSAVRHRVSELLERRGFHVMEGSRASEAMRLQSREYDVVVVELTQDDPGVRDVVTEVRRRHPATRVVGIPAFDGETIRTSTFAVHVDAHLLFSGGRWLFQPSLEDLLRERDRVRDGALRALQLSDEVRAKELEARTARSEGEAKLRFVVQSINEVLFRVDRSGAWIALSPAWSAISGYPVESSLGRPWIDYFHEDDRETLRDEFDALSAIERPVVRRQARILTRSAGVRWVEVRAQLTHDRFGNVLSAAGTLSDITERRRVEEALRRNEEYFRALIENAAEVIVVIDPDDQVRYTSPSVERVLGLRVADGIAVAGLAGICHPDDRPALRAALQSAQVPGACANLELRARHADGSWRHLAVAIRNLSHIPAVRGLVVNAHDVTAHRDAERALRESEEALFRARKMDAIGLLAGGVANDFNNLLTAIQGHADMAAGSLAPDHPIRAELDNIRDASARAAALTRQLLAFGRRQVLRPRSLDLNVFMSDLHKMLMRIVGDDIQLRTDLAASPDRVRVDPIQIERVVLNLAVNAREAMPRGGVLSIRTRREHVGETDARMNDMEPGEYVVLSVSDTGHGIAEEIRPHVFDPFFTTKRQTSGVGLGLSTVYGIVRQTGGQIGVESRSATDSAESGTTFTIRLPAASGDPSDPDETVERPARGEGAETIALVEDEEGVRNLASRILSERGYNVIAAGDGPSAMEMLSRFPDRVDLLLTDVVMPGMNGRDLADRIGMMRPGIRILFMSGYSQEAVQSHGVLARGSTFIEKPFSPDGLVRRVREILDGPGSDEPGEVESGSRLNGVEAAELAAPDAVTDD
jgi:diguanylate cyclase (GGDEF)-like protein/PAS domain S-box-containing protein